MTDSIRYALEPDLASAEFAAVLEASGLSERRPAEPERLSAMLRNADLIVTARDSLSRLVGVARSVTDFSFCCYLSDLAVHRDFQGRGIGQTLMVETRLAVGASVRCFLFAAPKAKTFYDHIGMPLMAAPCYDFTDIIVPAERARARQSGQGADPPDG